MWRGNETADLRIVVHAPFLLPLLKVERGGDVRGEELGDIESDTPGADDGDGAPDLPVAEHALGIAHDLRVVDALDIRHARGDSCRNDDMIEALRDELVRRHSGVQSHVHV